MRSRASDSAAGDPDLALPLDHRGVCIFHSQELEWKRENDFGRRFTQLLDLLEADDEVEIYDFAEFVFLGNEPESEAASEGAILRLRDRTLTGHIYFTGATFLEPVELESLDFRDHLSLDHTSFEEGLVVKNCKVRGLALVHSSIREHAEFSDVDFIFSSLFHHTRFTGQINGTTVRFKRCRFRRVADFSNVLFAHGGQSTVSFREVEFEDFTDFTESTFECHTAFEDTSFGSVAEFVDTTFGMVISAARYRGAAVEFNQIEVQPRGELNFRSNDPHRKMFEHDITMSFSSEPTGVVRFENVNFSKFGRPSRERLLQLEKKGRVEIGPGCIKYRHQTEIRSIPITEGGAPLILELCQTFANYFTVSNGINLGFEIVERRPDTVRFFYFTDEDIPDDEFQERLRQTEQGLWNLLAVRSTGQLLALQPPQETVSALAKGNSILHAIDGISALIGTFFRVGARIAFGRWDEKDTSALLGAIRFNEEGAEERAEDLHRLLVEKYTGPALFGINSQQNRPLPPLLEAKPGVQPSTKVRILFLGANSAQEPLALEQEIKRIQNNLQLAKERDNLELRQKWAVTVDSLLQAMLDESPTIVHFSGHGEDSGIILQDDHGNPKLVGADALASLFKVFRDTVQCVLLNSCFSTHQARAIRRHIPYVIGVSSRIPDSAAIAFSTGFYKALGSRLDIPFAFDYGKVALRMEGTPVESFPVLL